MESWSPWLVQIVFVLCSLGIVAHDHAELEVPVVWLLALGALPVLQAFLAPEQWSTMVLGSSLILGMGAVLLKALPDRLGEADVVFAASFPFVLGAFPLFVALALACAGGMVQATWMILSRRREVEQPIPFTPLLFWGALTQVPWGRLA